MAPLNEFFGEKPILSSIKEDPTTKEFMISLLAEFPGATCKQAFNILRKFKSEKITLQAVHKSLRELEEKTIVLKASRKYYLNINWVQNKISELKAIEEKLAEASKSERIILCI